MEQIQSIEIINGTLALDEAMLDAARIKNKARVLVRENSILILPGDAEAQPDVIAEAFGSFHLPAQVACYLAEDKEIEYDI